MPSAPQILLACATQRGLRCLERVSKLAPDAALTVVSFSEAPGEPLYLEAMEALATSRGATFRRARRLERPRHADLLDPAPDLILLANWRYLVPEAVLRAPRLGTFAFHDSLLPAYRGFSPTCWAMINGEEATGATLFEVVEQVDAGPIVAQERLPIGPTETIAEVTERVTAAYLSLLDRNLADLLAGAAPRRPQDEAQASYVCKRLTEDDRIDWTSPRRRVFDLVRARTRPYQGAFTTLAGERLRIWSAEPPAPEGDRFVGSVPGRVVELLPGVGVKVLAGDGPLLVREVQLGDAPPACAAEVIKGLAVTLGR